MKKITLLVLVAFGLFSCKDEPDDSPAPYPTDDLVLDERKNALLIFPYGPGTTASVGFELYRKLMEDKHSDRLNHISLVAAMGHPLYAPAADSLSANYGYPNLGTFILNGTEEELTNLDDQIALTQLEKAGIYLKHKVSEFDTAWVVDVKVRFNVDTVSTNFLVETYMVADVPAYNYIVEELDLRMGELKDFIGISPARSFWVRPFDNLDTTKVIIKQNEDYVHNNVLMRNFNSTNTFGTRLSELNPLGPEFFRGDVYGTRFTPIRHYFTKPKLDILALPYDFEPRFVTVIWYRDIFEDNYIYVNSYSDQENDD